VFTDAASRLEEPELWADVEMSKLPRQKGSDITKPLSVTFRPGATRIAICDLAALPVEHRAELWWQRQDFNEFLRTRVELGAAYRAVAEQIGVDLIELASIGPHGKQGYQTMIQGAPGLAHESRRGLGLGRRCQRVKNRDAYITAVLGEQLRQQEEASQAGSIGTHAAMLDDEELARVAQSVSEQDREYAHYLAQSYYATDTLAEDGSAAGEAAAQDQEAKDSFHDGSSPLLGLISSPVTDAPAAFERKVSPLDSSRGFGLTRDQLEEVGLNPTGHTLNASCAATPSQKTKGIQRDPEALYLREDAMGG